MKRSEDEKKIKHNFIEAMKYIGGSFSSLKLYPPTHPSVSKTINDLYHSLKTLLKDKNRIVIAVTRNIPVLDGIPIYDNNIHLTTFKNLIHDHGIEVIIIKSSLSKDELIPFLNILSEKKEDEQDADITVRLEKERVKNILIKDIHFDKRAKETYFSTIGTISKTLEDIRLGNKFNVFENKRSVKGIVNSILIDKNALLSLTMIKNFDDYLFSHSVNVCILATSLAEEMGYNDAEISEIALAGLLHDVGKLKTSLSVLQKPGKLNNQEWELMMKHPTFGSELLMGQDGINDAVSRMVYEHHMKPNRKGYPAPGEGMKPSNESQIIAIADTYDACTTLRPYQYPLTTSEAIQRMKQMTRKTGDFNPNILDVFIKMLGVYPIGAKVRLDTNELAVVSRYSHQRTQPIVKIFMDKEGNLLEEPYEVDLNDTEDDMGKPIRAIVSEIDANARNLDVKSLLA